MPDASRPGPSSPERRELPFLPTESSDIRKMTGGARGGSESAIANALPSADHEMGDGPAPGSAWIFRSAPPDAEIV